MHDSLQKYKLAMETEKQDQIAFREAVAAEKKRGVSKKSPYTVGFWGQVVALTKRQFQMRMQDKFQLTTSYSLSIVSLLLRCVSSAITDRSMTQTDPCSRHRSRLLQRAFDSSGCLHSRIRHVRSPAVILSGYIL